MSSSFPTLEEGMRIILDLLFLQEPFAFPTSCSLQLHWCWAMLRTQLSTKGLQACRTGVNQAEWGGDSRQTRECGASLSLPGALSGAWQQSSGPESEERVTWADLRFSSTVSFSCPRISGRS